MFPQGPFELTKLSAQVSVLMADRNSSSLSEPSNGRAVAASYQNKGTFKTAKNIVKHRGIMGLYSGFSLHLRKGDLLNSLTALTQYSKRHLGYCYLFHDIREQQAALDHLSRGSISDESLRSCHRWWAMWSCKLGAHISHRFR
jgi:hypothetical protein